MPILQTNSAGPRFCTWPRYQSASKPNHPTCVHTLGSALVGIWQLCAVWRRQYNKRSCGCALTAAHANGLQLPLHRINVLPVVRVPSHCVTVSAFAASPARASSSRRTGTPLHACDLGSIGRPDHPCHVVSRGCSIAIAVGCTNQCRCYRAPAPRSQPLRARVLLYTALCISQAHVLYTSFFSHGRATSSCKPTEHLFRNVQ